MLYEVRAAANKGLGLFARSPIERGTRILAEKPLVGLLQGQKPNEILTHAASLSRHERRVLLNLSWYPGGGVKRLGRWGEVFAWALRDGLLRGRHGVVARKEGDMRGHGRRGGLWRELREGFEILSIFRSNSFNLLPSSSPSPSPATSATSATPTTWSTSTSTSTLPPPGSITTSSRVPLHNHNLSPQSSTVTTESPPFPSSPPSPSSSSSSLPPPYALALFPTIARINHSCIPNAQANYHPDHDALTVHATRSISAGEQVSINYLAENGQLRRGRVAQLQEGYGFTCDCAACDVGGERGRAGEEKRRKMQDKIGKVRARLATVSQRHAGASAGEVVDAGYGVDGTREEMGMEMVERAEDDGGNFVDELPEEEKERWVRERERELLSEFIGMLEGERIRGRELATMYHTLARQHHDLGDYESSEWAAECGLALDLDCLGEDHPSYQESLAFVEEVRKAKYGH